MLYGCLFKSLPVLDSIILPNQALCLNDVAILAWYLDFCYPLVWPELLFGKPLMPELSQLLSLVLVGNLS